MNQSIDTLASSSAATNLLEAAVRHEPKEIKDQLGEMNQSIDTLASSSAATNLLEAAVCHEPKEIKDQLGEMNQFHRHTCLFKCRKSVI